MSYQEQCQHEPPEVTGEKFPFDKNKINELKGVIKLSGIQFTFWNRKGELGSEQETRSRDKGLGLDNDKNSFNNKSENDSTLSRSTRPNEHDE